MCLQRQGLPGGLQAVDAGVPDQPRAHGRGDHTDQCRAAHCHQGKLPDLALQSAAAAGFAGLVQRGDAEIQLGGGRAHTLQPLRLVLCLKRLQLHAQDLRQLVRQALVSGVCARDDTADAAASGDLHGAEIFHMHGHLAELIGGIHAAEKDALVNDLPGLHKGHGDDILLQSQMQGGVLHVPRLGGLAFRGGRFGGLFAAQRDLGIQAVLALLSGLGEGGAHSAGNAVTAVVDACHRQATGVGHRVIPQQKRLGDRPKLYGKLFQPAVPHFGADDLPNQLILLHIHREIGVHIGLQQFFDLIHRHVGDILGIGNDLRGAKGKYHLAHALKLRLAQRGVQHILHQIGVPDHAVLHSTHRGVYGKSVQDLGALSYEHDLRGSAAQLHTQHLAGNFALTHVLPPLGRPKAIQCFLITARTG